MWNTFIWLWMKSSRCVLEYGHEMLSLIKEEKFIVQLSDCQLLPMSCSMNLRGEQISDRTSKSQN